MRFSRCFLTLERPDAEVRLIFFHHAAGSASSYLPFAREMPTVVECSLFELAGRGLRSEEPYATDFSAAAEEAVREVNALADRPLVLFGHSLGGLLAHHVACSLPAATRTLVQRVIASACYSPGWVARSAVHPVRPFTVRTHEQLMDELRGRGGCPQDLLDDEDFVTEALDVLGNDLHLADTYVLPSEPSGVHHDIWYGADDPYLSPELVEGWTDYVAASTELRTFRGGHFYTEESGDPAAALRDVMVNTAALI